MDVCLESLEMDARDCTQLLSVVQRNAFAALNYLRFQSTSASALECLYRLSYLIVESCSGDARGTGRFAAAGDFGVSQPALACMLLKLVAWKPDTIAPELGQGKL
jgi:hypothetical protein